MKKIIFLALFSLIFSTNSYALKVNDTIDNDLAKELGLKKNSVNIIDFFASWCVSCEKELPLINKLYKEKITNLNIIGIDTDEEISKALEFQKKLNLEFKVINDNNLKLVNKFSPIGMPAIYFIENNKIKKIIFGAVDEIDEKIISYLQGK